MDVVNEFPAPPSYYLSFTDDSSVPEPPAVPTVDIEVYGGSVTTTPLTDIATFEQFHKDLKQ